LAGPLDLRPGFPWLLYLADLADLAAAPWSQPEGGKVVMIHGHG